jgi:hypothetical protein
MTSNIKVIKVLCYGAFALNDDEVLKFENRVLKRILGPKRVDETRHFKKLHNEEFNKFVNEIRYLAVGIAIFHFHFETIGYKFRPKCIFFGQNILSTFINTIM